jgi:hypothetical protein
MPLFTKYHHLGLIRTYLVGIKQGFPRIPGMQLCGQSPLFPGEWQKGKPEHPAHALNLKSPKAKPDTATIRYH